MTPGAVSSRKKGIDGQIYVTEWTYDAMDRVISMTYPNLNESEVVSYTYNDQLLLASMTSSLVGNIATDITYNALDLPTQVKLSNNAGQNLYLRQRYYGSNLDYGVYPYGALWDIRLERGSPVELLLRLEHGYDFVRNVTRTIETPGWIDFTSEYDDLDRFLKRKITGGADQETVEFDNVAGRSDGKIGNIVKKNGQTYLYQGGKPHAVTNDGVNPYGYDANGNMTQRGTGQYIMYDAENRPVKVSSDQGGAVYIARFAVDGDGKRVKRVDNFGTIHYVGAHYERNVGTPENPTEVVTKFYHAQMGRVSRLIAFKKGGTLYYVAPDHLGGTVRVVEPDGDLVDDIRYQAFGATRSGGTNTPTDKRFTGQTLDMSTGLYYYGARSYDPGLARFAQPDNIVPQPGNPQSLNRYSYVLNNPLKYIDPTGKYVLFVAGMGTSNDSGENQETWGFLIEQMGLKEGEYGFFDWGRGWNGPEGLASSLRPLDQAAGALSEQIAGKTDIKLIGHSRGGALVMEYMAQVAEGRLLANEGLVGGYTLDAALAPLNSMVENPVAGQRYERIGPFATRDRYANLPSRLAERGLAVSMATFDNPADWPFTTHEPLAGIPRYEWAVGPPGGESLRPVPYWKAAHGLLLADPRVGAYFSGYAFGGW